VGKGGKPAHYFCFRRCMGVSYSEKIEDTEFSGNNTIVPLAADATFTGVAELNNSPHVGVSCFSDTSGTLYFDFSINGTDWRTFPTSAVSVFFNVTEYQLT